MLMEYTLGNTTDGWAATKHEDGLVTVEAIVPKKGKAPKKGKQSMPSDPKGMVNVKPIVDVTDDDAELMIAVSPSNEEVESDSTEGQETAIPAPTRENTVADGDIYCRETGNASGGQEPSLDVGEENVS